MNCSLPDDPCPAVDSGGARCEMPRGHEDDLFATGHYVSSHTIRHAAAGNGHSCGAVERAHRDGVTLLRYTRFVF